MDPEDGSTLKDINDSIEENPEEYRRYYRLTQSIIGENANIPEGIDITDDLLGPAGPTSATETDKPAKRTRKSKNQPDPATAVAPPPLAVPVPEAALTAPVVA